MKKSLFQNVILAVTCLFLTSSLDAQSPQGIPYQAVMRNADGSVMASSAVSLTFMIHDGTANGTVVYQESHALTSNTQGLVSCVVGNGVVLQGNFSNINWGNGAKFLQVMMGGVDLGTQQLLSVPYAFYAGACDIQVSLTGDTLYTGGGNFVIIPGISAANYPPAVLGCTDNAACNYNSAATQNDNSCLYIGATCDDGNSNTNNDEITADCQCNGSFPNGLSYNVTFKLNLNEQPGIINPNVSGTFNNWCGDCALMTDANQDGIWELTLNIAPGNYEYIFSANNWGNLESLSQGSPCTASNYGYTNRLLEVSSNLDLTTTCWNSCSNCIQLFPVQFKVNMNGVSATFNQLGVGGTFNNWNPQSNLMSDTNGDGVYETTVMLSPGTYQYKFAADGWVLQENLIPGSSCTNTEAGFTNRIITVFNDGLIMAPYCWGTCDICGSGTGAQLLPGNATCATQNISVTGCGGQTTLTYDGRTYDLVEIGGQCWFADNLATDQYRNGDPIPTGLDNTTWQNTTAGAFAIYNNDAANDATYGKLYNWYTTVDSRGLCPTGWHVPTDCEWMFLEGSLGMTIQQQEGIDWRGTNEGGALKATTGWTSPNTGATNSSGFTAFPGGYRNFNGTYGGVGFYGYWWSSTEDGSNYAWNRGLAYVNSFVSRINGANKLYGFSVRCVRD